MEWFVCVLFFFISTMFTLENTESISLPMYATEKCVHCTTINWQKQRVDGLTTTHVKSIMNFDSNIVYFIINLSIAISEHDYWKSTWNVIPVGNFNAWQMLIWNTEH